MALKRRTVETKDSKSAIQNLTNGGEYEGRLVYVADLGLQERNYNGDEKPPCQKIALGIEILGESVVLEDKEVPRLLWTKPFNIFSNLTEKGKELEYYKIFDGTAQADEEADWDAQLNKPVNVTIVHSKNGDATYDNIASMSAIPQKYQKDVAAAELEPAIGDSDDPDNVVTKSLYGLTKWTYDRRIVEDGVQDDPPFDVDDEIPY